MSKDTLAFIKRRSQYVQTQRIPGIMVGQVVDVRDPWRKGRVKVQVYGVHGDYPEFDIGNLDYIPCAQPFRGAFTAPQLGDRVLISFQAGDKNSMMVVGYVLETPMGDGKLFWNSRVGTEVRPEGWHHRDLYPESLVLASSGLGNTIWIQDIVMGASKGGTGDLSSQIRMEDTDRKSVV